MTAPVETRERSSGAPVGLGILAIAPIVGGAVLLLTSASFDTWGALLVAPPLIAVSIPILRRQARREGDSRLFAILVVALVLKLAGAVVRYHFAFSIYEGGDASGYHEWGVQLSDQFRHGDFATGLESLTGTNFIRFFTGIVYTVTGPTRVGGFLVFSWIGFWGLFLFYRAYTIAVPEGRRSSYTVLVFFLPSLLYWPSSIGKEAWMMLALGLAALGVAKILAESMRRGLLLAGSALWLAALVRPHVAGLMAVALAGAFMVKPASKELRQLAPIGKGLALACLAVIALVLVIRTDRFLKDQGFEPDRGVGTVLEGVGERTQQGGSSFAPSIFESPTRAPVAAVTVLYRPFPVEAHNAQALLAGIEGSFLLLLTLFRLRWIVRAIGSIRRQPYVAFAIAYCAMFIVAFSGVANFGLLARERVQLLPLFLVLLTVPPPDVRDADQIVR